MRIFLNLLLIFMFSGTTNAQTDVWVSNNNDTVTDVATGLIWQAEDDDVSRNQADAITYCNNLTLGGSSNWRLPNIKELLSIVDYRAHDPAIDKRNFSGTNSSSYWSVSSRAANPADAWVVDFLRGNATLSFNLNSNFVRCVL